MSRANVCQTLYMQYMHAHDAQDPPAMNPILHAKTNVSWDRSSCYHTWRQSHGYTRMEHNSLSICFAESVPIQVGQPVEMG